MSAAARPGREGPRAAGSAGPGGGKRDSSAERGPPRGAVAGTALPPPPSGGTLRPSGKRARGHGRPVHPRGPAPGGVPQRPNRPPAALGRAGPEGGPRGAPPRWVSGMSVCQFERPEPFAFPQDELLTPLLFPQFPAAPPCWWSSPPTSTFAASASSSSITSMPSSGTSKAVASSLVQRPGPPVRSSLCQKRRCRRHRLKPRPGPSLRRPKPSQVFWCYIPRA